MPATEQTWRNNATMHVVFGLTSLLLLVTTLWMFVADHSREWKRHQRKFRRVETWAAQSRMNQEQAGDFETQKRDLAEALDQARSIPPDKALVDHFVATAKAHEENFDAAAIDAAYAALADKPAPTLYDDLLASLRKVVTEAIRREKNALRDMKFRRAELDVVRSDFDRGVGEGLSEQRITELEGKVRSVEAEVETLTLDAQEAKTYRVELEKTLGEITHAETAAKKAQADHEAELARLQKAKNQAELSPLEKLISSPILDAFGHPEKIEQIWLPKLTINNNFRDVARFDRCITCHQAIDKTAPGTATVPGYPHVNVVDVVLATPAEAPKFEGDDEKLDKTQRIEKAFGIKLAKAGIELNDVAVEFVWPETAAAAAGIRAGDVLHAVGDVMLNKQDRKLNMELAERYLLDAVRWGEPIQLAVRRGMEHPFSSHPRLDLFVGPMSPHKMGDVGCTVCHDGQGSATDFKWASHSPSTPQQEHHWVKEHGWFNNHHWIFPMYPKRFAESTCLKCHHEVTELEPSEKFPDPPAEKLVQGYHLIRRYGCYGCHEINGFNGPDKRVGPDLRSEPTIFAAAKQLLANPSLPVELRPLAEQVASHPENEAERRLLAEKIRTSGEGTVNADAIKMAGIVGADYDTPGKQRKPGPSLRHLASKSDANFVYNWVKEPKNFRPSSRMPQFFGLWDHLLPEPELDAAGNPVLEETVDPHTGERVSQPKMIESQGLADAKRFEPVELHAVTHYLLTASQAFEYLAPPAGVTAQASAERGRTVFEQRGCLACHSHKDFPEGKADQGPDLSQIGAKLSGEMGQKWLYSWVKEPNRYHARTVMPNLFLDPITAADGTVSDPAADVTAYLMASQGWQAPAVPALNEADLDQLALEHLSNTFTARQAKEYLQKGIPESRAGELKGDEVVLLGSINREKKLTYVGRRTISKLGCAGCHDIPGYEDSKPIGAALADWGRKDPAKLAFEQVNRYMDLTFGAHGGGHSAHGDAGEAGGHGGHGIDVADLDPDTGFFMQALQEHRREGFVWQKLREPRSYDYMKTENKTYNERLRMPKFPFSQSDIEAVMTFVLGLVSEPPADQYVFHPDPHQKAIVEGRQVLERFNCGGCHQLDMERWTIEYDPNTFPPPPPLEDFAVTLPHFTPKEIADSQQKDARGLGTAVLYGAPLVDAKGAPVEAEDDNGNPAVLFTPWKPALINGQAWLPGVTDVILSNSQVTKRTPGDGGDLARLLYPRVLVEERANNPNVKDGDAWGWVPPPLVGEGTKVQPGWLHAFLLDPYPIRPAVVLRMPKFNMSSTEASHLVNYFAAKDNAEFPYEFEPRTQQSQLAAAEAAHPNRFDDALKLVTNRNFCVQCHLVGDFMPTGSVKAQAPNLERVHQRLRPDFIHKWIANPKRLLPYTGMPVNFPYGKEVAQDTYRGDSEQQIEALTDLLLNYDTYMKRQTLIAPKVPPAAAASTDAAGGNAAGGN